MGSSNPIQPSRPGPLSPQGGSDRANPRPGEPAAPAAPPADGLAPPPVARAAVLRVGSRGPEVVQLQQALRAAGAPALKADGVFGERTKQALTQVQQARGLQPDGVVGPRTRRALGLTETAPAGTTPAPQRPAPIQPPPLRPPPAASERSSRLDLPDLPEPEIAGPYVEVPWKTLAEGAHQLLEVPGSSERLSDEQVDDAFLLAGRLYGVPTQLLEHTAHVEASDDQSADGGPAHGLMQIEKSVHGRAYQGGRNVGNDTISNVLYGARLRNKAAAALDAAFKKEGLAVPQGPTRAALVDYGYNRGPGILAGIARRAREQGIDPQNLQEYWAGKGGTAEFHRDRRGVYQVEITPGPGVTRTGEGSVLQEAIQHDVSPHMVLTSPRDHSHNGVKDHFDVWIQRTGSLLDAIGKDPEQS